MFYCCAGTHLLAKAPTPYLGKRNTCQKLPGGQVPSLPSSVQLSEQKSYCGPLAKKGTLLLLPALSLPFTAAGKLSLCAFIATFKTSTSKTSVPTISALVNRLHCEENSFRWAGDPETTLGWLHCHLTYEGFKKLWRVLDFSKALAESQPMQKEELFHLSKGMLIIYWL